MTNERDPKALDSLPISMSYLIVNHVLGTDTVGIDLEIIEKEIETTLINTRSTDNKNIQIQDVSTISEIYRNELKSRYLIKREISSTIKTLSDRLDIARNNYRDAKEIFDKRRGFIQVVASAPEAVTANIKLKYFTNDAGWNPVYDLRAHSDQEAVQFSRKAEMFQFTGADWQNIDLTLTNNNPNVDQNIPELRPFYITRPQYAYSQGNEKLISGKIMDEQGMPLVGVNVIVAGTQNGTISDLDGNFLINSPSAQAKLTFSYSGYDSKSIWLAGNNNMVVLQEGMMLDEVVITGSASRYSDSRPERMRKEMKREPVEIYREITEYAVQFKLTDKISLPSSLERTEELITQEEVTPELQYFSIPKLAAHVYLQASIENWESMSLLSGNLHIYLDDVYRGVSYLDAQNENPTLDVSLGIDNDLVVTRKKGKIDKKKTFFKNKVVELVEWEITIRNNKVKPIDVVLIDQYPLSDDEDVEVKLKEFDSASVTEKSGKLVWQLNKPPSSSSEKSFMYEVKYPRGMRIME